MFPCLPTQKGRWLHDTKAAPVQGFEDHQAQKWGATLSSHFGGQENHPGEWSTDGDSGLVTIPNNWWCWLQTVRSVGEL